MRDYKKDLIQLVDDMNCILCDSILYAEGKRGEFELVFIPNKAESIVKLYFKDRGCEHEVYSIKGDNDSIYLQAYFKTLKDIFIPKDWYKKLMEEKLGEHFDYISFQTLFESGLNTIKQK